MVGFVGFGVTLELVEVIFVRDLITLLGVQVSLVVFRFTLVSHMIPLVG